MSFMADSAYASIWSRDFSEETFIERWKALLETVPFSAERPGFTDLVIRAVDMAEAPILEQDLRAGQYGADVLADLAREHVHADCSYETQAFWDLWSWDETSGVWKQKPQPLTIICYGSDFDEGIYKDQGHFLIDAGFEHFFTGHGNLLGFQRVGSKTSDEAELTEEISQPENLRAYQEKTRENIRKLHTWMARIEGVMPVERLQLWSEGEENFEARVEEILATR